MSAWRKRLRSWMLRRLPLQRSLQLNHQRIYLLPTRMGWMLLLVSAAVWLGALNYAVSLAYALSFWLVSLLLLSVGMAFRQLLGVKVAVTAEQDALAGHEVSFTLDLGWASAEPRRLILQYGDELLPVPVAGGELILNVASRQRGICSLPALQLYSEAPLGLIRAFAYLRLQGQAYVYPEPIEDAFLGHDPTSQGEQQQLIGQDTVSHLGTWQADMGLRRIAWKHYAKRGELLARHLQGEMAGASQSLIAWDAYPAHMNAEQRLSRMCWQLLAAMRNHREVCLRLPGREQRLAASEMRRGLRLLATFGGHHA